MLPPMRIRQYSISSSPLASPTTCTLTYAVVNAPVSPHPTHSTAKQHPTKGIATTYLASLTPGDVIRVAVRPSHTAFHPPLDVSSIPVLLLCAGSGLAPFRGFVQERACQLAAGRTLAPALLFIGCRAPIRDALYTSEFKEWEKQGAVSLRYAFSRAPELSEGCKYVQDRLWKDREEVEKLWEQGARIFVCGSGDVGEGVREGVVRIAMESVRREGREPNREKVEEWFRSIRNERFASDVFA